METSYELVSLVVEDLGIPSLVFPNRKLAVESIIGGDFPDPVKGSEDGPGSKGNSCCSMHHRVILPYLFNTCQLTMEESVIHLIQNRLVWFNTPRTDKAPRLANALRLTRLENVT